LPWAYSSTDGSRHRQNFGCFRGDTGSGYHFATTLALLLNLNLNALNVHLYLHLQLIHDHRKLTIPPNRVRTRLLRIFCLLDRYPWSRGLFMTRQRCR
jgi:hypothetical protein